jgi:hypothetical protein
MPRPDGLTSFATDTVGQILVTTPGSFTFALNGVPDGLCFRGRHADLHARL